MAVSLTEVVQQFAEYGMPRIGETDLHVDNGKFNRYGPQKKAYYKLFSHTTTSGKTFYFGTFGFKGEGPFKVERSDSDDRMTPEEFAELQRAREAKEREELARRKKAAAWAANRAKQQWRDAQRTGRSDYLARKQVAKPESVRFMVGGDFDGYCILPLIHYGRGDLVGSQKISPNGTKRFNSGMDKIGAACRLGDEPLDGDLILIGEGYATCASGREGVDYAHPVYMALDAGNLLPVAKVLRERYPASPMLFLGDDDYLTGEAGRIKAEAAVAAVGNAALVLPCFVVQRAAAKDDPAAKCLTDFNDLHCAEGIAPVQSQLTAAIDALLRPAASPAPTQGDDVDPPAVATDTHVGGAGVDADKDKMAAIKARQLYQYFALVDGKTRVVDMRSPGSDPYTLPALKAKFGKQLVDEWLALHDKRHITQAELSAAKRKREQEERADDPARISMMERYVYLDGTTTVWDSELRDIIPVAAMRERVGSYYKEWVDDPARRVIPFSHVRFAPGLDLDQSRYINLFTGMEMQPAPVPRNPMPRGLYDLVPLFPACENIIALAYHLCDARDDVFEWLLNWIAYPLQHVGAKLDTAILMHGSVHGSGKSMFWEKCVKPLYGRYAVTLGQDQLDSTYTGMRSGKLFMLFEEVVGSKQRYAAIGKIKQMVTGVTQVIEKKFMNAWEEENHGNCVFLSNAIQPLHVESYDRRFQVIWPIETADTAIYGEVDREVANGGLEAFLAFLQALPLTLTLKRDPAAPEKVKLRPADEVEKFDAHSKPLLTDEKKRLIRYGLSGWELFLHLWSEGELYGVPFVSCLSKELYKVYVHWCREDGETPISANKFSAVVDTFDRSRLKKGVRWYRIGTARGQATVFKVEHEPAGVAEMDYLGDHIVRFRVGAGDYGVTLDAAHNC